MEKSLKWKIVMWGLMAIIAFWIVMLPGWSKAEPRPWTDDEKVFCVWGGLAGLADIYTTTQFLRNPDNWEVNPVLGRRPDPLSVVSYIVCEYLVSVTIAHFWPDLKLPLIGKVNMRHQILYNRASRYTSNACWNARLDW